MHRYQLQTITVTPIATNCYILIDEATKQAAVIDPGASAEKIKDLVDQAGATVCCIINTHGHWDHVGANQKLKELTGAPLLIHRLDAPMLADARSSSAPRWLTAPKSEADRLLEDQDTIAVGELTLTVLHTPGHSPGSICLQTEDLLFTGDTLFYLSMGRTDLVGGDPVAMTRSLARLSQLEGDYAVLPGHEQSSRLAVEKAQNPYMPR